MLSFSWRVAILVASFLITTQGLYCGNKNCYEILEVNQYHGVYLEPPPNKTSKKHIGSSP